MVRKLIGRTGPMSGADFPLDETIAVARVGAAPANEICVRGRGVSREHARIVRRDDALWIEDVGSTNGTFVNGQRVKSERLRHLDVVTVGRDVDLIFVEKAGDGARPAAPSVITATLEYIDGPAAGTSVEIPPGFITLGRGPACNIVFDHRSVGKTHARIVRTDAQLTIEDLQSANGTFVNGRKIQNEVLKSGDKIALGGVRTIRVSVSSDFRSGAAPEAVSDTEMQPLFDQEWRTKLVWSPQELAAIEAAQEMILPRVDTPRPLVPPRPGAPPKPSARVEPPAPVPQAPRAAPATPADRARPPEAPAKPAAPAAGPRPPVSAKPPADAAAPPPPRPPVVPKPRPEPSAAAPVPEPLANRVTTRDSTPPSPPPAPTLVSSSARPAPPAPALSGIKGVEVLSADKTLKRVGVGEFAIGRSVEAGIRLDTTDREVSRSHALLSVKPDRVEIEDRSQNGTFVNNERITGRKALQDGDQVRCGSITMTIRFTRGR